MSFLVIKSPMDKDNARTGRMEYILPTCGVSFVILTTDFDELDSARIVCREFAGKGAFNLHVIVCVFSITEVNQLLVPHSEMTGFNHFNNQF